MSNGMTSQSGGSLIGGLASSVYDDVWTQVWNASQMSMSKNQWEDQMYMAKNKYQIMMEDLRKAGLNPILAAGRGLSGAGGVSPVTPHITGTHSAQGYALSQQNRIAARAQKSTEELNTSAKEVNEQKKHTEAEQQHLIHAQAEKVRKEQTFVEAQTLKAVEDTKVATALQKRTSEEARARMYENYQKAAKAHIYSGKKGKFMSFADWILQKLPFVK